MCVREISDILNLLQYACRNWEDIGTVGKLRLGKISICFCSDNHACTHTVFYETCWRENVKYLCKACVAPIAFTIMQFKEGVQYSGQCDFSGSLEIRKSHQGSSEKLMLVLKPVWSNCWLWSPRHFKTMQCDIF